MQPKLIILSGPPCSGKTTFSKNYHPQNITISRDDIRETYWDKYYYSNENENKVTAIFDNLFEKAVNYRFTIILDNTHCKEKYINQWIEKVPEGYGVEVMFFYIPKWKAYYRNVKRWILTGKWIPFKVMNNMYSNYNKIDKKKYEQYLVLQ